MGKKKNATVRGTLPLAANAKPDLVVTTVTTQLTNVQACADYANQPGVQAATGTLKGSLGALSTLLGNLANARALATTLETQRDAQIVIVHRDHDALESALNSASQGVAKSIQAWGAVVATHTVLPPSTAAPTNVQGSALGNGLVLGQCKRDRAAICYLFQTGTDPTNLGGWPPGVVSNGCRHTFSAPAGQKLYFRIAVQRTKTGLGQWSDVVEVTVR